MRRRKKHGNNGFNFHVRSKQRDYEIKTAFIGSNIGFICAKFLISFSISGCKRKKSAQISTVWNGKVEKTSNGTYEKSNYD